MNPRVSGPSEVPNPPSTSERCFNRSNVTASNEQSENGRAVKRRPRQRILGLRFAVFRAAFPASDAKICTEDPRSGSVQTRVSEESPCRSNIENPGLMEPMLSRVSAPPVVAISYQCVQTAGDLKDHIDRRCPRTYRGRDWHVPHRLPVDRQTQLSEIRWRCGCKEIANDLRLVRLLDRNRSCWFHFSFVRLGLFEFSH